MDVVIAGVILAGVFAFLIGHSFIDSFFRRKEELLTRMYEKGEA